MKPDGSVTTTVYDDKQRITSTVEKTATEEVITGFEYTYDALSRIVEEKHLAENTTICYTYDSLNRMTNRTVLNACDEILSEENYSYDAAGNIIVAPNGAFQYDVNNRLISFGDQTVEYDLDGNMLTDGETAYVYDSANRLIKAGDHAYTYNAEDVRIRNLCSDFDTTYTYNTNCKLSQLLMKSTNGNITKYVYGLGLLYEEKWDLCKIYHFDYRGSTVALTSANGAVTDTFKYDAYGQLTERTGDSFIIFGYNGRDGVVTDKNGLIYMRARYYSPQMKRFINADVLHGEISDSVTLNRYAYANGNPVSNVDPFGLSVDGDRGAVNEPSAIVKSELEQFLEIYSISKTTTEVFINDDMRKAIYKSMQNAVKNAQRPNNIGPGLWAKQVNADLKWINDLFGDSSKLAVALKAAPWVGLGLDTGLGLVENVYNGASGQEMLTDLGLDLGIGAAAVGVTAVATPWVAGVVAGSALGSAIPVLGTVVGALTGLLIGIGASYLTEWLDEKI